MIAAMYIVKIIREEQAFPTQTTDAVAQPIMANATTGTATAAAITATDDVAGDTTPIAKTDDKEPITSYQTAQEVPATTTTNNFYVPEGSDDVVPGGSNSFKRIKYVLCYDKGMAVYILIFLFWIVWMGIGCSRLFGDVNGDDCDELTRYMTTTVAIGYVWMSMVGM